MRFRGKLVFEGIRSRPRLGTPRNCLAMYLVGDWNSLVFCLSPIETIFEQGENPATPTSTPQRERPVPEFSKSHQEL